MNLQDFISKPHFNENIILKKDPAYPKISVVTPSYNQAQYLQKTILSVLNQNYPNLQYSIIDGGSTDGSIEIIKSFERYLTYWVSEKDSGQSDAINKGFKKINEGIVTWQNSDDIYLPGAFMKIAQFFLKNSAADVVFGNFLLIDSDDTIIRDIRLTPFSYRCLLWEHISITNQSAFWRKELFDKYGYLETGLKFAMDFEWWARLGSNRVKFCFLRDYLGCLRQHSETKTFTLFDQIGVTERARVREKYGMFVHKRRGGKIWLFFLKTLCLLRRFAWYSIQGDYNYIVRGIIKRTGAGRYYFSASA